MGLTLVTAPTAEPLTLAEAKLHLRLDSDVEIDRVGDLIVSAREDLDGPAGWLGRAIMPQTWDLTVDRFPDRCGMMNFTPQLGDLSIEIPLPPLQSVTSIGYIDQNGDAQTLATTVYRVVADSLPGKVILRQNQSWPLTIREPAAVTIRFVAGYAKVPQKIRSLMLEMIGWRFANREGGDLPQSVMDQVSALKTRFVS